MIDSGLNFAEHMHMVSNKANGIMAVSISEKPSHEVF